MKSRFYYIVILYRYNKPHVSHCNIIIEILYTLRVICFGPWITEWEWKRMSNANYNMLNKRETAFLYIKIVRYFDER